MVTSTRIFQSVNPADPDEVVGEFRTNDATEVAAVMESAAAAQRHWARQPPSQRAVIVGGIGHALARETHEVAALITREEGKTLAESRGEVLKSAQQFLFASQLAYLADGTTFPDEEPDTLTYTVRDPVGVVVAITPYNFPVSLPARKIAAALALGNAVVFKPSPVTPACGELLVHVAREAGLPDGVLQVVHGTEASSMAAMLGHSAVGAVTFTGSDRTGDGIRQTINGSVRVQMELSGHNATIVCADADLEAAATGVAGAAFGLAGQACTSTDRVLVADEVYDDFRRALAARVAAIRVGSGATDGVTCGPVATAEQQARLLRLADDARNAGARVVAEAGVPGGAGYFVAPTLFENVPEGHPLAAAEIFGPYTVLVPVGDADAAVRLINDGRHGLVSAVYTRDMHTAMRCARDLQVGVVKVNRRTTGNGIAPPFGGLKASSAGGYPEGGRQAVDFFTTLKTVYGGF
ncbi:MAG: aldehyde dehydrogenase family protein [Candidatus Dormibacteria bacterium]